MLLSHKYKNIGWLLSIPSFIIGIYLNINNFDCLQFNTKMFVFYSDEVLGDSTSFGFEVVNITNTIVGFIFIAGCLLIGFSKEKVEDEYIKSLRLSSLQWSVLVNYLLLMVAFLFIYGVAFLNVMLYNMFTVLILFIARFNYLLYRNSKSLQNEE